MRSATRRQPFESLFDRLTVPSKVEGLKGLSGSTGSPPPNEIEGIEDVTDLV